MKNLVFALLAVSALAAGASAQEASTFTFERKVPPGEIDKVKAEQAWLMALESKGQQVVLDKVKAEQAWKVALETKTVQNAPYSAEAVSESIQSLADGNRIVHRTSTRVYRDSAGRTRRETLDDSGQVILVSITDPAAGSAYVVDTKTNTVSQTMMKVRTSGDASGATTVTAQATGGSGVYVTSEKQQFERGAVMRERVREPIVTAAGGENTFFYVNGPEAMGEATREDLGQQTIEGVTATGMRTTTVIPAGAIGNEQPIRIVSEEWTSPELQALVLTKHSDPRTGETTYRLTGITRTEPPKSLFDAPEKK